MLNPHHLKPPISYLGKISKDIPPYLRYWVPLAIYKKTPPFPGFLGKSSRDYGQKYPLSRENGTRQRAWGPLCIRVGARVWASWRGTVGRGLLANHSVRVFCWQIWPLFHSLVVICEDPCNFLKSMFLDMQFLCQFISNSHYFNLHIIIRFIKSDNEFFFILQDN